MPISVSKLEGTLGQRSGTFTLDLRSEEFPAAYRKRIAVRDPAAPKWPVSGPTTNDRNTAILWLPSYADMLNAAAVEEGKAPPRTRPQTVGEAGRAYVELLERTLGPGHNTSCNRRSHLRVHIEPKLGTQLLSALNSARVQGFLESLHVTRRTHGKEESVPAALNMKLAIKATLREIWRFSFRTNPPFNDVKLRDVAKRQVTVKAILEGRFEDLVPKKAYDQDEITRLLVRATMSDMLRAPNISESNTPYTATAMALQYGMGARIVEFTYMRWRCLTDDGLILIPGTKNANALRYMLVFDSVRPWIEEARKLAGDMVGPMDWLLRVDPRLGVHRQPAASTLQSRYSHAMAAEGLKVLGKSSHMLRASLLTAIVAEGMDQQRAKLLIGHAIPGGATDRYLSRRELLRMVEPADWQRLRSLPTPDEVRAMALARIRAQRANG
jgi:integrase